MFRLLFGAVIGGLIMWFFGNQTQDVALGNRVGARAVDQPPSSADTAVRARDRAKEQVHSGHSATSTIDPSPSSR